MMLAAVVGSAFALTGLARTLCVRYGLLDAPNARSSHTIATPRGGGLAIAASVLVSLGILARQHLLSMHLATAILFPGATLAALGFLDDRHSLPRSVRFMVQSACVAWFLVAWGIPPSIDAPIVDDYPIVVWPLTFVAMLWLINLFNFMDGIDALAASEAVFFGLAAGLIILLRGTFDESAWLAGVVAASAFGFLVWNWPPARIFMGDVGSLFLGFMLGSFAVVANQTAGLPVTVCLILMGIFVVDATITLVRRALRTSKFYEAHRTHAYQFASRKVGSHRTVTLAAAAINAFWLFPLALAVSFDYMHGWLGVSIAYAPLIWLALRFRAGVADLQ